MNAKALWKLLTEKWKFTRPSLVLSVAGGAVAKNYAYQYLLAALTKLLRDTSQFARYTSFALPTVLPLSLALLSFSVGRFRVDTMSVASLAWELIPLLAL